MSFIAVDLFGKSYNFGSSVFWYGNKTWQFSSHMISANRMNVLQIHFQQDVETTSKVKKELHFITSTIQNQ